MEEKKVFVSKMRQISVEFQTCKVLDFGFKLCCVRFPWVVVILANGESSLAPSDKNFLQTKKIYWIESSEIVELENI